MSAPRAEPHGAAPLRRRTGYLAGLFDRFDARRLTLIRDARAACDRLVVGVTTDALAAYRREAAETPLAERMELVRACRYVDAVVPQATADKFAAWEELRFDVLFVGEEWFDDPRWQAVERRLAGVGVAVVCLPGGGARPEIASRIERHAA